MKKTLLGVLAFVLVLATVLTGTVLAADDTTSTDTKNLGEVKMVDADHPIIVDGQMDEAYTTAIALPIKFGGAGAPADLYTRGVARFVWSKAENALYCHVIMNDADVAASGTQAWNSDSVELFLDLTNTGTQNWGIDGLEGEGQLRRGLQYRIEGYKGIPTCYLEEDDITGPVEATYYLDVELGRMANNDGNRLINENTNIFGWEYSEDATQRGWGYALTPYGYMVEFRINAEGQGITLADGLTFRFDFQVNDRFNVNLDGTGGTQVVFYYASTYRSNTFTPGVTDANELLLGDPSAYHDTLTLSDEVVRNTYSKVSEAQLANYGMEDATFAAVNTTASTERTYTEKYQIATRTKRDYGNVNTTKAPTTGGNKGTTTATGSGDSTGSGCGGSIAIGTSVAVIALVGATGFFAFRRKDDE